MPKLHLRFKHIKPETVEAAQALFASRPWSLDQEGKQGVAQAFVDVVCGTYAVPTCQVQVVEGDYPSHWGTYEYTPEEGTVDADGIPQSIQAAQIFFRKFSIINLFGMVRTHLLNHGAVTPKPQDEPWGWACSLFYIVNPVGFRARVREGRIRKGGIKPADTYGRNTFARMVAVGVATETGNVLVPKFDPRLLDQIEAGELDVRTLLPEDATPSSLSGWSWDDDEEDEDIFSEGESTVAPYDHGYDDAAVVVREDVEVVESDGLDALTLVQMRRLIRGRIPGGYSLSVGDLREALRAQGIDSTGEVRQ